MAADQGTALRRLRQLGRFIVGAVALTLVVAAWMHVIQRLEGQRSPFLATVVFVLPFWLVWAFYAPLVDWLAGRLPFERGAVLARSAQHLCLAVLMSFGNSALRFGIQPHLRTGLMASTGGEAWPGALLTLATLELPVHLFIYAAILGATYIIRYNRRLRERELAASRLSAQLAEARVHALRMQLNPHFLFNALNSVAMLVRDRKQETAVDTLEGLSDLLRHVLEESPAQEVPLAHEIDFIERYLAIEQIRFQDRLQVRIDVDADTLDALVPNLVLQPIVENAIRHGIAGRVAASAVVVTARREGEALGLRVEDDGPGFGSPARRPGTGLGISNTRTRLRELYGADASLAWEDRPPTGAAVTITLPFHTEPRDREEAG